MTSRYTEPFIWGFDTETMSGPPITLQFYSGAADMDVSRIYEVDGETVADQFYSFIEELPSTTMHVLYAHNLKFDLVSIFYPFYDLLAKKAGFRWDWGDWQVEGVHGQPTFCILYNPSRKTKVYLLDSASWFNTSLEKAAELVCPHLPKLKMPEGLGQKLFGVDDGEFVAYAMRDAEVSYHIGKVIARFHEEFDIRQSRTLASMASTIFRKHFLSYNLEQPSIDQMISAQRSYHGGKNNVTPGSSPKMHRNVAGLDISSAYPFAMSSLPSFSHKHLYKKTKITPNRSTWVRGRSVPRLGVYCVSGVTTLCEWPSLFDVRFKPIRGEFFDTWVSSFDLNAALERDEVKIKAIRGYHYDETQDRRASPFDAYVRDFYKRKQEAKDPVNRFMYKTILNSLYGKFIQTTPDEDEETGEIFYKAGPMYHPFIASMITGHTRAYIHELEHTFEAVHTATDGVFAPWTKDLPKKLKAFNKKHVPAGQELGKIELEARGDLLLLRNKLYILYSDKGKIPSYALPNKKIEKYALHGFMGNVHILENLIAENRRDYTANKPNQLRESLKSKTGKLPNNFENKHFSLKIDPVALE